MTGTLVHLDARRDLLQHVAEIPPLGDQSGFDVIVTAILATEPSWVTAGSPKRRWNEARSLLALAVTEAAKVGDLVLMNGDRVVGFPFPLYSSTALVPTQLGRERLAKLPPPRETRYCAQCHLNGAGDFQLSPDGQCPNPHCVLRRRA